MIALTLRKRNMASPDAETCEWIRLESLDDFCLC